MLRAITFVFVLVSAVQTQAGPRELEYAWRTWMKENGAEASTLAIILDGEPYGSWGHGIPENSPLPLASLSKAVTGACILALQEEGLLSMKTTLGVVFAERPDLLLPTATDAAQITIGGLLTHSSGLNPDLTQDIFHPAWWGLVDGHDVLTTRVLQRRINEPDFFYSNENYAVLGSVIEEVTGTSVEEACSQRVLIGLETAAPSVRYGATLAYAGWAMSSADYARFADTLSYDERWPLVWIDRGLRYGPGVDVESSREGEIVSHSGSYCLLGSRTEGSFFAKLPNGITFALAHDLCLDANEYWDMVDTLMAAAESDGP